MLLVKEKGQWQISAVIDWADAELGVVVYEWVALWLGLCQHDKSFFRAILSAYNPQLSLDENFQNSLLIYALLHRFSYEIITDLIAGEGICKACSLADVRALLRF